MQLSLTAQCFWLGRVVRLRLIPRVRWVKERTDLTERERARSSPPFSLRQRPFERAAASHPTLDFPPTDRPAPTVAEREPRAALTFWPRARGSPFVLKGGESVWHFYGGIGKRNQSVKNKRVWNLPMHADSTMKLNTIECLKKKKVLASATLGSVWTINLVILWRTTRGNLCPLMDCRRKCGHNIPNVMRRKSQIRQM